MKLKKLLKVKLLVSLLMILTSVTQAADKTVLLDKGVPADFPGYLIPDRQWQALNQDLLRLDMMEQRQKDEKVAEGSHMLSGFIWGFVAGTLTVFIVDRYGGK